MRCLNYSGVMWCFRDSIARSLWAETYLVDGDGIVRLHYRRAINERDVTESILPLLRGAK